jgi:hypothetical protein
MKISAQLSTIISTRAADAIMLKKVLIPVTAFSKKDAFMAI